MNKEYIRNFIEDIYQEGDIDLIFLEQIYGFVCFDENDFRRIKSKKEIFEQLFIFVRFFCDGGDFAIYIASKTDDGKINYSPALEKWSELEAMIVRANIASGEADGFEYRFILKKQIPGKEIASIPEMLFEMMRQ